MSGMVYKISILVSALYININYMTRKNLGLYIGLSNLSKNIFGRITIEILIKAILIKILRKVIYEEKKFLYYLKLDPQLTQN